MQKLYHFHFKDEVFFGCHKSFNYALTDKTLGLYVRLHDHDYYEIALLSKGRCIHYVNGTEFTLSPGTLIFMRDTDTHCFMPIDNKNYVLHNISFNKSVFEKLLIFLDDSYELSHLFNSKYPYSVTLTPIENEHLTKRIELFSCIPPTEINSEGKKLLFKMITDYFLLKTDTEFNFQKPPPQWFIDMCTTMTLKENYQRGISIMPEISNKSPSYIAKAFQTYMNTTPTEFVNQLRLNYAERLLLHTNTSIIDICYSVGFNNESWFYKKFKERHNMTPFHYRKLHKG
ncbi:MAG: AraC family transcriptional regulator [Clostridia bacterium]|nr:AraC family transcriptional regulator [Clostridia bacterium]